MTKTLSACLVLSAALSLPALAQVTKEEAAKTGKVPAAAESEKKIDSASLEVRMKFDADSAKGEVTCKEGNYKDGKVEYKKCVQDKLDKYDSVAIEKKIVLKEKYDKLEPKEKRLAKKLAFLHSAHEAAKAKVKELKETSKDELAIAKNVGAQKKIDSEFDKSLSECAKKDKAVFTCPTKD